MNGELYNLDGTVSSLIDHIFSVAFDLGCISEVGPHFYINVLHVVDEEAALNDDATNSYPVARARRLDISTALEGIGAAPSKITTLQVDKLCRIISGTDQDEEVKTPEFEPKTVAGALSEAFAGVGVSSEESGDDDPFPTEIILSGGSASDTLDIERIKSTPKILDEEMVEDLGEMLSRMGFSSASIGNDRKSTRLKYSH